MNPRKKKSIQSVEVDKGDMLKVIPPQYAVTITYNDGTSKTKRMVDEDIQLKYSAYLKNTGMFTGNSQQGKKSNIIDGAAKQQGMSLGRKPK